MEKLLYREGVMEDAVDVSKGIRASFSSETPVFRRSGKTSYWEILSHAPGDCMMDLLNREGVVLENHDDEREIGTVVKGSVRVEADRKLRATVKISDSNWAEKLSNRMRPAVSIGYTQLSVVHKRLGTDGIPVLTFSWAPHEVTLLTADKTPADDTVGLYRSKSMTEVEKILSLAIHGSKDRDDGYSLQRAFLGGIRSNENRHKLSGIEKEVHQEVSTIGRDSIAGTYIPFQRMLQRDLQATVYASGGAFVQTDLHPFIPLMFNRLVSMGLGCTVVPGLKGNAGFPRVTSSATPQMLGEIAGAAQSQMTFDQPDFAPRRCTAQFSVSLQGLIQGGIAFERVLVSETCKAIAVLMDRMTLWGQGAADEPLGIVNTPGVGTVTYGGATDWTHILANEKAVSDLDFDDEGKLGWAISPSTRNKWKNIPRISASSLFIMEGGKVNDYPALVSNQIGATNQSIFGKWDELMLLVWGDGFDVLVDDKTQAANGKAIITVHVWFNCFPAHPQAFIISSDSAAQ